MRLVTDSNDLSPDAIYVPPAIAQFALDQQIDLQMVDENVVAAFAEIIKIAIQLQEQYEQIKDRVPITLGLYLGNTYQRLLNALIIRGGIVPVARPEPGAWGDEAMRLYQDINYLHDLLDHYYS